MRLRATSLVVALLYAACSKPATTKESDTPKAVPVVPITTAASLSNVETPKEPEAPKDRLVAHEWGTFTSLALADGALQLWEPLSGPVELPSFIHGPQKVKAGKATIRMETPVIYFYSDLPKILSVKVGFPKGQITEWYPEAAVPEPSLNEISWGSVSVKPGTSDSFKRDPKENAYYTARQTDAAPLEVVGNKTEQEKFLFYRGVGNFEVPISVKLDADKVIIKNLTSVPVVGVIVFEKRDDKVGYHLVASLDKEEIVPRPFLAGGNLLAPKMETLLTKQGLDLKEAQAMIKTWEDQWFSDGLRVFYLLPRENADEILPLSIEPAPQETVRVFVGRMELLTPEMVEEIKKLVSQLEKPGAARDEAIKGISKYGRFARPVLESLLATEKKKSIQAELKKILK